MTFTELKRIVDNKKTATTYIPITYQAQPRKRNVNVSVEYWSADAIKKIMEEDDRMVEHKKKWLESKY